MQKILVKAYTSQDSSDYYFKKAKKAIVSVADEGEFYFCKSARQADFGSADSAIYYANIAIPKLKEGKSHNSLLTVYNNLGHIYNGKGQYDKAINYRIEALKIAESQKKTNYIGHLYTYISYDYHDFENYEKGIFYGKKALQTFTNDKASKGTDYHSALNAIAINYDDWNKPELALYYHKLNFKYVKGKDTLILDNTYNNIGNTLLKQKKFAEAKKWIVRSKKIIDYKVKMKMQTVADYEYATYYTNLATIASELNEFEDADKYFDLAFKYSKKCNVAEKLRDYYFQKAKYNKKRNNLSETIKEQENYIKLRDSIYNVERDEALAKMEVKYQTEKKQKQLLIAKNQILEKEEENEKKTYWLIFASFLILSSVIIGYLFFRQQKLKNKQQEHEFELKNAIAAIETQNKLQEQRLTISRDLHDNIGAQLTFIISSVENLKFGFPNIDDKISNHLSKISNFTKDTIVELRDTIWAMNSHDINIVDLRSRLLNFIEKAQISSLQTNFKFTIDDSLSQMKISSLQGINIYRVIQEAVNNAIKHANAQNIEISAKEINNALVFDIFDDGVGFKFDDIVQGNGLHNMKKRIEEIGGQFQLNSTEKGTHITITI
ncbi:tetratricopeptide repeat-containing sensor histidine kinase [Flavobacterium urocaniciphilum]|uniref:tetratricopeptide repeat-containing sensor histidine kinase n=1 Tax=Flavobacterium urocaniciphilum TaxID=1299341 RepID=UPI0015A646F3|nr:sensor histidine kinase [Flavobacterium urocaniciphilum]